MHHILYPTRKPAENTSVDGQVLSGKQNHLAHTSGNLSYGLSAT